MLFFIVALPVLSIVGQNILEARQAATVKMECTGYQRAYDQAIATHADAKTIRENKLILGACNARKEACLKDLAVC